MKRFAEGVSIEMGYGGELNDKVLAEGQRRLNAKKPRTRHRITCPKCLSGDVRVRSTRRIDISDEPERFEKRRWCECLACLAKFKSRTRYTVQELEPTLLIERRFVAHVIERKEESDE